MFETNWLEMKVEFKLESWIQNGFWPFKTQRNARKLLTEAKFESPYLFQVTGRYFEPENKVFAWAVGEFEFPYEFQTHHLDFKLDFFFSTYKFKIDLEFTQISNSTTRNRVWVLKHVEMSFKCLNLIQNASYSFRTHKF